MEKMIAIIIYIIIMNEYYTLRMKSFNLSLLKKIIGIMKGRIMMLIGKKVIVIPLKSGSKLELFLSLMIFILLRAARFF